MFIEMLYCLRLQHCIDLCLGGLLLFLAGLQQVEAAAAAEMVNLNWKPFIYGGMASIVAEFGRLRDAPQHADHQCSCILLDLYAVMKCKHMFCANSLLNSMNLQSQKLLLSDGSAGFKNGRMHAAE